MQKPISILAGITVLFATLALPLAADVHAIQNVSIITKDEPGPAAHWENFYVKNHGNRTVEVTIEKRWSGYATRGVIKERIRKRLAPGEKVKLGGHNRMAHGEYGFRVLAARYL